MDAEIQRRRTFEIIAKWIGKQRGITIEFIPDIVPCADPVHKIIRLPKNVKEENLDKVIALVLHEAAHIKKSDFKMKELVATQEDMAVLNTAEDIRIDNDNMSMLPRIRDFYEELIKWEDEQAAKHTEPIPFEHNVLCDLIRIMTGFPNNTTKDKKVEEFINKNNLNYKASDLIQHLNQIEWSAFTGPYKPAKKLLDELVNLIYGKGGKRTPVNPQSVAGGAQGQGQGQQGQGKAGKGKGKNGKDKGAIASGNTPNGQEGTQPGGLGCGKHSPLFEIDPHAKYALDEVSLDEQTIRSFSELLTVKSVRVIHDGMELDTGNLTAYFTGAIDELFKERKIEKIKKSKILMLFDSSGSMHARDGLADNVNKTHILIAVGNKLKSILDDIREVEGINVDYDVRAFDTRYIKLSQENWASEYMQRNGGGTDCALAFECAMDEILADPTIDGNKMIILITDGQIDPYQVQRIQDRILKHSSDVKCMILGVGLDKYFETQLGGRNIMAKSLADGEILQAIEDMLE